MSDVTDVQIENIGARWTTIGNEMKDVLSLVTFAIIALCFAVFVATVRPLSAGPALGNPANCMMASSGAPGCGSEWRWWHFTGWGSSRSVSELPSAASSGPTVERELTT
jgi:hypothetical protein